MGYISDLDDVTTEGLKAEIARREDLLARGKCPYCFKDLTEHTCRYKDKLEHFGSVPEVAPPVPFIEVQSERIFPHGPSCYLQDDDNA